MQEAALPAETSQSSGVDPQAIKRRTLGAVREFWPALSPAVLGLLPMAKAGLWLALNLDRLPSFLLPPGLRDSIAPEQKAGLLQLHQYLQNFEASSSADGEDKYLQATEQLVLLCPDAWLQKWGPLAVWVLTGRSA